MNLKQFEEKLLSTMVDRNYAIDTQQKHLRSFIGLCKHADKTDDVTA